MYKRGRREREGEGGRGKEGVGRREGEGGSGKEGGGVEMLKQFGVISIPPGERRERREGEKRESGNE